MALRAVAWTSDRHSYIANYQEPRTRLFLVEVMEYVDGEDLEHRLRRGPIPVDQAIAVATQIARGLEAAHEQGIIHRDLKPANVKLRPDGTIKVLDFGLAKALEPTPSGRESPTMTSGSGAGVILGTAAYMSPEQARGRAVDKRTDIWAFGCVLFEILTGQRAFGAASIGDTVVAVLEREPDWPSLPPAVPARLQWLLRRCLEKDPRRRLHDMADVRIEIEEAEQVPSGLSASAPRERARLATRERVAWGAAAIALLAFAAVFVVTRGRTTGQPAEDLPTYSASILIPDNLRLWSGNPPGRFALSPDGRLLALVASDASGHVMLWIRPLDTKVPYPLAGTDGASFPFWSADSRFIAFLADRKLKKIQASGGDVVTLCDAAFGSTGTWSRDDVILFTPGGNSPLFRVSASSGVPTQVTALDASSGDVQHSYPSFLPDGRHFLYFVVGSKTGGLTDPRGVYGGSLDSNQPGKLVLEGGSNAKYANGHLIFLREGTLLAQLFDIDRLELRGEPIPLVEQVQVTGAATTGTAGGFSVSQTGLLVYQTGISARSQLAWYDRTGVQLSTLGDRADYGDVALSPDGSRLAVSVMDPPLGTRDLWIFEVARGLRERFSFDPGDDFGPNWSRPDGTRIAFSSRRHGGIQLYEKPAGGSGSERVVLNDALGKFNPVFSPDGSYLLYVAGGGIIARSDLWALPLSGGGKPAPFLDRPFVETQGQFSPDGRWVAYASNESGSLEVNVTPFPGRGDRFQVSTAGGSWPRWNQSGKEIFYLAPDNTLTAVPVRVEGSRFDVGAPRPLFVMHPRPMVRLDAFPYDVTPDGQRFLVNTFVDEPTSTAITLVVNWMNVRRR